MFYPELCRALIHMKPFISLVQGHLGTPVCKTLKLHRFYGIYQNFGKITKTLKTKLN